MKFLSPNLSHNKSQEVEGKENGKPVIIKAGKTNLSLVYHKQLMMKLQLPGEGMENVFSIFVTQLSFSKRFTLQNRYTEE